MTGHFGVGGTVAEWVREQPRAPPDTAAPRTIDAAIGCHVRALLTVVEPIAVRTRASNPAGNPVAAFVAKRLPQRIDPRFAPPPARDQPRSAVQSPPIDRIELAIDKGVHEQFGPIVIGPLFIDCCPATFPLIADAPALAAT